MERTARLRDEIGAGIAAGITGGILLAVCLQGAAVLAGTPLGTAIVQNYSFIASVAIGPSAFRNPGSAVPIGILIHFCIAIAWALGYVYLVRAQPQLIARPIISGLVFGLVVDAFMNIMLIMGGVYHRPSSPGVFGLSLLAHCVFYGIPVAVVVSRLLSRSSTASGQTA
ncbi:MAG TPA: hypothetical protein VE591_13665 [Candidatus Acidoferrum sp.]|nr:hypothetical protein [Candidatus Acidoferrum sp.]